MQIWWGTADDKDTLLETVAAAAESQLVTLLLCQIQEPANQKKLSSPVPFLCLPFLTLELYLWCMSHYSCIVMKAGINIKLELLAQSELKIHMFTVHDVNNCSHVIIMGAAILEKGGISLSDRFFL